MHRRREELNTWRVFRPVLSQGEAGELIDAVRLHMRRIL